MTLTYKVGSIIAAGLLYAMVAVPAAFANTEVDVRSNGAFSDNDVRVSSSSSTRISQSNRTNIDNNIQVSSNTGNNSASFNTGGNSEVDSGDASTVVFAENVGGSNVANVDTCGCDENIDVEVRNNGAFSENDVRVRERHNLNVRQQNDTRLRNRISVYSNTGGNSSSFNTDGSSSVSTGEASTLIDLINRSRGNRLNW